MSLWIYAAIELTLDFYRAICSSPTILIQDVIVVFKIKTYEFTHSRSVPPLPLQKLQGNLEDNLDQERFYCLRLPRAGVNVKDK